MTATASLPNRIQIMPVPCSEPPYDDERQQDAVQVAGANAISSKHVQGALALAFALPSGLPAIPAGPIEPAPLRVVPDPVPSSVDDDDDGPRRHVLTPRSELPDPRRFAGRLAQAIVEVVSGGRPAAQLARWTTQEVYDDIRGRLSVLARSGAPGLRRIVAGTVRSVHVTETASGVAEVCAVVQRSGRAIAVALRLEGLDGRWMCTQLAFV
jgi:hypothetical protein